jgi:hypothetical protein
MYWEPQDLEALHGRLRGLGFSPGKIVQREYGRREFVLDDADGYNHCFGVPSE